MAQCIIQDVLVIKTEIFSDTRGVFESVWEDQRPLSPNLAFKPASVNFSHNTKKETLRGMHYQKSPFQQSKLVTCVNGSLLDVVVDLRIESLTYKRWAGFELTANSGVALFVPRGCAHGFLTLEDNTTLVYLIDGRYMPDESCVFSWNDSEIAIDWPTDDPIMSDRDKHAPRFSEL